MHQHWVHSSMKSTKLFHLKPFAILYSYTESILTHMYIFIDAHFNTQTQCLHRPWHTHTHTHAHAHAHTHTYIHTHTYTTPHTLHTHTHTHTLHHTHTNVGIHKFKNKYVVSNKKSMKSFVTGLVQCIKYKLSQYKSVP